MRSLSTFFRRLARRPAYVTLAVTTLALGIGVNASMFSLIKAVLLRQMPWLEPERLVLLREASGASEMVPMTTNEVLLLRDGSRSLAGLTALDLVRFQVRRGEETETVPGALVLPNFFEIFGVAPERGNTLAGVANKAGDVIPVVISRSFADRFFPGTDPLGADLSMRWTASFGPDRRLSESFIVAGVLPSRFVSPIATAEIFAPIQGVSAEAQRSASYLFPFGRLAPGQTVESAKVELDTLIRSLGTDGLPDSIAPEEVSVTVRSISEQAIGALRPTLWVLFGASLAVLLLATANVASLVRSRIETRRAELRLRAALGASAARLGALLLAESAAIALAGLALGALAARAALGWLQQRSAGVLSNTIDFSFDRGVFSFAVLITGALLCLFGLLPALKAARGSRSGGLRDVRNERPGRWRGGAVLVQTALAVLLLIGASLLLRSLQTLLTTELGFDPRQVATFEVSLPATHYDCPADCAAFTRRLLDELTGHPAVIAVGAASALPLGRVNTASVVRVPGFERPDGRTSFVAYRQVSEGYFTALGAQLREGRWFSAREVIDGAPIAIVNAAFQREFSSSDSPLERSIDLPSLDLSGVRIIGVVADLRESGPLRDERAIVYLPDTRPRNMGFALLTAGDPAALLDDAARIVRSLDPALPLQSPAALSTQVSGSLSRNRFFTNLLSLFAALALTLAAVGIFGTVHAAVSRRRGEIALRTALGATPGAVLRSILASTLVAATLGLLVGLAAAAGLARYLANLLHGVGPRDPVSWLFAALVVCAALAAALAPAAVRALRVAPAAVLREL